MNIAKLRLWLSLVVDYARPGIPPTLPNLDFKIECGEEVIADHVKFSECTRQELNL